MKEIWCVIESSSEGEIFSPDFFNSKEKAVEFIEEETKECLANMMDLPEAGRMTDIVDGDPIGEVWTDKYSWVWHGFEVTDKLLSIYLMSYMKTKENDNNV